MVSGTAESALVSWGAAVSRAAVSPGVVSGRALLVLSSQAPRPKARILAAIASRALITFGIVSLLALGGNVVSHPGDG